MRSRQRWRTRHFVPGWSKWLWKYKSLLVEGKEPELWSEVPESYSWAHLRAQPAFWKHCPGDGAGFCSSVRVGVGILVSSQFAALGFPQWTKGLLPHTFGSWSGSWLSFSVKCESKAVSLVFGLCSYPCLWPVGVD